MSKNDKPGLQEQDLRALEVRVEERTEEIEQANRRLSHELAVARELSNAADRQHQLWLQGESIAQRHADQFGPRSRSRRASRLRSGHLRPWLRRVLAAFREARIRGGHRHGNLGPTCLAAPNATVKAQTEPARRA